MIVAKQTTVYFAAIAIAAVAWILNAPYLYWMAGALFLLPRAANWFGKLEHRGIRVERESLHAGEQGEAIPVRFRVRNLTFLPKMQLSLSDELPPGLTRVDPEPVPVHLPPHGTDQGEYLLQLRRRGVYHLEGVNVQSTDMLGLSTVRTTAPATSELVVYPRVLELPSHALPPARGGGYAPLETAGRQGQGSSFFGIREYRPGDPLRHVHWPTTARRGRLAVVEWEAEESTDTVIAVETGENTERALPEGTTLDLAASLAASLAALVLAAGDSVRLLAPGAAEWRGGPERGTGALPALLESLARMRAMSNQGLASELRRTAPHLAPGTMVLCLVPEADAALLETIRHLRAAGLRPVVYALESPERARHWDAAAAELESLQVPVIRLRPGDDLTRRLLS